MSDLLQEVYNTVLKQVVEDLLQEGKSTQEIESIIESRTVKAMESVTDKVSEYSIEYMKAHMHENELAWQNRDAEFFARQEQKWGHCFAASRMMYTTAIDMADTYVKYVTNENTPEDFKEKQYTFYCLVHLHARACQEFLEILTLMRAGFADGAYARCRSLFELCCVASFIKEQGETIAEAYFKQSESDYKEKAYVWAKSVKDEKGDKVQSFGQIQKMCSLPQPWKDGYDLTCAITHASPQATFGRLSNGIGMNIIPVGRSDYNIKIPAEHSASCLRWITSLLLTIFLHVDSLSNVKTINQWSELIRDKYYTTHDKIFADAKKSGIAD